MRRALTACALTTMAIAAAGCGDGGNSASDTDRSASAPTTGKELKFIYVGNQPKAAATIAKVANGLKAADEVFGTTTEYRSAQNQNFDPNEERRILESALAQKPDGLIVNDFVPPQLNPTIKKFTDAGIPVVLADAGLGQPSEVGALTFVGNDNLAAGRLGGELLGKNGAKHSLLLTLQPGVPLIDDRTKGFQDGFPGKVTTVQLAAKDLSDSTKIRNVTEAALEKDDSIDAVFSTGGDFATGPIAAARARLGERTENLHVGVIDVDKAQLEQIKAGTMDFALDQQPFLMGFQAVQSLVMYSRYALRPGADFVPTGPVVVDKSNVDAVSELSEKGVR